MVKATGGMREYNSPYQIQRGSYRSSSFSVDKNFSSPSPEIVERMRRDFEITAQIYRRRSPRQWHEPFQLPVTSASRNNFGDRRIVNGTKHYRHAGLDFASPTGTPVHASNNGIVAFSGEQWTPGQTIFLDHGGGIFSKYMHLSERLVSEGETVKRGQVIAATGHSGGQKPGPHLHMDMVINGSHVDPLDFFRTASRLLILESAG
jgi:murein DD-endopeptidase MepM/ murein hydrolase activator NlpD